MRIAYFGSASDAMIAKDFAWAERQSFSINRDSLWASEQATDTEVRRTEGDFVVALRANDPAVGYNRWPRRIVPVLPTD